MITHVIQIGRYNNLTVDHLVDFGAYLRDEAGNEVLLPRRYVTADMQPGQALTVFVYIDAEDRPVATTERPIATVGEFALMRVKAVTAIGAFLDWGLAAKDLLVPFREQRVKMRAGRSYVVAVYEDLQTERVAATAKLDRFLGQSRPDYYHRQRVEALVVQRIEVGYRAIINNRHWGMIYANETHRDINVGDRLTAYVKQVRPDGKVDVTVEKIEKMRVDDLSERILDYLHRNGGSMQLGDHSTPDEIEAVFRCSKKDFKKAIGLLYRQQQVTLGPTSVTLTR